MRIRLLADGRVFQGTAHQIAKDMQSLSFTHGDSTLSEYIDSCNRHLARIDGVQLEIVGETDREKAISLVTEMLAKGLATSV